MAIRRKTLLVTASTFLALGLISGGVVYASTGDTTCRKGITRPYSNDETVSYAACRADLQDQALRDIAARQTAAPTATVTATPKPGPTVTVTSSAFPGPTTTVTAPASPGPTTTVTAPASPAPTQTVTVTASPSSTPTGPASGTVLFSDDFTGPAGAKPDPAKWREWSGCTFNSAAYYGKIDCGLDETVDGQGHLSIPADPNHGSSLSTKDTFKFVYGTMTARMMVQTQPGYWPAFWALNGPSDGSATDLGGEGDVLEAYTRYDDGYRAGIHNYDHGVDNGGGPKGAYLCGNGHDIRGEWHDYGMRFEPNRITILFDGNECFHVTKADLQGNAWGFGPDNAAGNWMLLTNAIGGAGGQQDGLAVDPSVLLVDSVKVTAL